MLKIRHIFKDNDISFTNLENVFCACNDGLSGQAHLIKSRPGNIESISGSGINVVSLANNHILDFGEDGLQETLSILEACNIKYTGAGRTLSQARTPAIFEKNGIRFGFLAYAMKGIHSANTNTAGAAWINYDHIAEDIHSLRPSVDHIIVSLHEGLEFIDFPHPNHRHLCLKLANLGASLIIGHHPHVIHGIEIVNNCLIAYSLGNLVFDSALMDFKTDRSKQGIIIRCTFNKERIISHEIIPTVINKNFQPEIADKKTREIIMQRLNKISLALGSSEYPGLYFKQAGEIWPGINIAVNLKILKEQGLLAFLKRLPRVKLIYIMLVLRYAYKKTRTIISGNAQ